MTHVDMDKLSDYLIDIHRFVYEAEILKFLFPDDNFYALSNIELYRKHFTLFHNLYLLRPLLKAKSFYLHIHFMRIGVVPYPAKNKCLHFDKGTLIFCEKPSHSSNVLLSQFTEDFCEEHLPLYSRNSIENIDSTAYFYLDKANYDFFSETILESWLSGLNQVLRDNEYFHQALALLDLSITFDLSTLKASYKELAKKYHPDRNTQNANDYHEFLEINRAYQYLLRCVDV